MFDVVVFVFGPQFRKGDNSAVRGCAVYTKADLRENKFQNVPQRAEIT